jgi:hypothetical protein
VTDAAAPGFELAPAPEREEGVEDVVLAIEAADGHF